jgi:hypothetical protein
VVVTTILELQAKLRQIEASPRAYFGDDIDAALKQLQKTCHPDRSMAVSVPSTGAASGLATVD